MMRHSHKVATLAIALSVSAATIAVAAANVTQYSGSEGAIAFNNASAAGSAIEGTVSPSGNASFKIPFGVLGAYEPSSSSTFGIGFGALSTNGDGIYASASGPNPAMIGIAESSGGAVEVDSPGNGIEVNTATGIGATVATTGSATAVTATSPNSAGAPIFGDNHGADSGFFQSLAMSGNTHVGGTAYLGMVDGIAAAAFGNANTIGYPALKITQVNSGDIFYGIDGTGANPFRISGSTANASGQAGNGSDVEIKGDLYVHGAYFTCAGMACIKFSPSAASDEADARAARARPYRSAQLAPSIEDTGENMLSRGSAYVPLDPAYAKAISSAANYLVFVTPEGETHGLFVAARSRDGFTVREHGFGRSNAAFTYRIVARPLQARSVRSPFAGRRILERLGTAPNIPHTH